MNKKIIGIIICILLIGTIFNITLETVRAPQDGDYIYTVSDDVATITDYTGAGGTITIPSTLGGYPVAVIGSFAFDHCTSLTSVTIPNSVTTIGSHAFARCYYLTSVTIGNSVTTIGSSAFHNCGLTSIIIPDNVTTIGNNAFSDCHYLSSVTIGNSVTTIAGNAFGYTSLTSVTIGNSVTTIGSWVFQHCNYLTSVTIGNSVTTIGDFAFYCVSLTSMTFLGLLAPTTVGTNWIYNTPPEIRGHAYAASNFPPPGSVWNGLTMGTVLEVNQPPTIEISYPKEGQIIRDSINIIGESSDEDGEETIQRVEVRIDDGTWDIATDTEYWSYDWDISLVSDGFHIIYARSYDGLEYSAEEFVRVIVKQQQYDYLFGVDVSDNQGNINWKRVANDKDMDIKFAFVKSTSGDHRVVNDIQPLYEEYFIDNMDGAKKHGIIPGAYHFAYPYWIDSLGEVQRDLAVDEANWFLQHARNYIKSGYLRPALDLEIDDNCEGCNPMNLGHEGLTKWVHTFMNKIECETNVRPLIYTGGDFIDINPDGYGLNLNKSVTKYDLWLPLWRCSTNYRPSNEDLGIWNDKGWEFWQYSGPGSPPDYSTGCGDNSRQIDGINQPVDLDVFDGDAFDFNDLIIQPVNIKEAIRWFVPEFSQLDDRWKDDQINDENGNYCSNIRNIGCAMTSSAMVLNFSGVDTDPGKLNEWLNSNSGYKTIDGVCGYLNWIKTEDYCNGEVDWVNNENQWTYSFMDDQYKHWDKLNEEIQKGPVIVKVDYDPETSNLDSHFVVVTGFKAGLIDCPCNYYINDPAENAETLNYYYDAAYDNTFFGMRFYKAGISSIYADVDSPCELRVYDSQNRCTGLIDDSVVEEIPISKYFEDTESVNICFSNDDYGYYLKGKEEGTYTFSIRSITNNKNIVFVCIDIPIKLNSIHEFLVDWPLLSIGDYGITLNIDNNNDGIFEITITSDSELTNDEFLLMSSTTIDIDPNTLYTESNEKWITCFIELPEGFDLSNINISSILLNSIVSAQSKPINIDDYDHDGVPDLMIKFNKSEVAQILQPGDNVKITVSGELFDNTWFEGIDYIKVI